MHKKELPKLAVTMGDPSGIGPEIIVKALSLKNIYSICRPVVVADPDVMRHAVEMVKADLQIHIAERFEDCLFSHGTIDVIDLDNVDISRLEFGKVSAPIRSGGLHAAETSRKRGFPEKSLLTLSSLKFMFRCRNRDTGLVSKPLKTSSRILYSSFF